MLARHVARLLIDLVRSAASSGLWWIPVAVPALAVAALAIATAKVVVPTAVYVIF